MDLTPLTKLETVGQDAFGQMPELKTVTLSKDQAQVINPGVFSIADSAGGDSQDWSITITGGSSQTSYTPTTWPSTTVTVANNLNRLDKSITEINLANATTTAGQTISTLEGGVLFGNEKIEKLVLPASASSWKLTEVGEYESAPVGNENKDAQKLTTLEFSGFSLSQPSSTKSKKNAQNAFDRLTAETWSQVASILNMFGYVSGESKNLLPWKESFSGELDADSVKLGWTSNGVGAKSEADLSQDGTYTKTVNGVTWKYTKASSGSSITLTIHESSSKAPNAYRAGYTGNAFASYQVGFATTQDGAKIDHTKTVEVKLTLVGK